MTARMRFRATTWLAIAGYALLASGLPLPLGMLTPRGDAVADTRLAAKDRSRPFPCMDKPCGCATAEQCFATCCCHTPAERLAWAKAHSVEPAVLVALERRVAADAASTQPAGGCCAAKAPRKPACCSAAGDDAPESAPRTTGDTDLCAEFQSLAAEPHADDAVAAGDEPPPPDTESPAPPRLRSVTLQAMLACGGSVTQWLAVGGALPPLPVDVVVEALFVAVCICGDRAAAGIPAAPALPPPRAA